MKYQSPNGDSIVGTAETLYATAKISEIDPKTGMPIYTGDTDIHWDIQQTRTRGDKILFVCESGHEWTLDELKQLSPDAEISEDVENQPLAI